jgi:hypothetical protein
MGTQTELPTLTIAPEIDKPIAFHGLFYHKSSQKNTYFFAAPLRFEAHLLGAAAHAALRLVVAESVLHGVFEGLNVRHIFFFLLNVRPG